MDEEYTEYIEKFKEYYEATTDCHSSRDMDAICQERELLFAYMCEMKEAQHYIQLLNLPQCLYNYTNPYFYPEINDAITWCFP